MQGVSYRAFVHLRTFPVYCSVLRTSRTAVLRPDCQVDSCRGLPAALSVVDKGQE
jgi:hypothetical protein